MDTFTVTVEIHHGTDIRRGVVLTPPIWPYVSGVIPYIAGLIVASSEVSSMIEDIDAEIMPREIEIEKTAPDCFIAVVVLGGDK